MGFNMGVPELPQLEALTNALRISCRGRRVDSVRLTSVAALKTYQIPISRLTGLTVANWERRGKHICADLGGVWLVIHLGKLGWVEMRVDPVGPRRLQAMVIRLSHGETRGDPLTLVISEAGTEKRLALWVVQDPMELTRIASLGPDPLDQSFSREYLQSALQSSASTLKTVLTDQTVISGIGNSYSDEILHRARLSPFRLARTLDDKEVSGLWVAATELIREEVRRAMDLSPTVLRQDKRQRLGVHGRVGEPCPTCGSTVRQVSYKDRSLYYCPECQTGGRILADRRLSRLLK